MSQYNAVLPGTVGVSRNHSAVRSWKGDRLLRVANRRKNQRDNDRTEGTHTGSVQSTRLRRRLILSRFGPAHADLYLHARPQAVDDRYEPINGEAVKVRIADAREVRRRNACAGVRGAHRQPVSIERLDDFGRQDRLELFGIGVLMP